MIIEIESMNESQLDELKKFLERSNGYARIFIHASNPPLGNISPIEFLVKILTSDLQKEIPIIIFEDPCYTFFLEHYLEDQALQRNVYLIKTKSDDPEPEQIGWDRCIEMFKDWGIKNIVVGGNYLFLYDKKEMRGCAYYSAFLLSQHFNVTVSRYVTSGTPAVYKKYCGKFKPSDHTK
ncbi:MAG: hypothetical protein JWM20_430 [Patescibacteria group bacterium]|nr:hypothetical protein [Patescibacteria group bacterium]